MTENVSTMGFKRDNALSKRVSLNVAKKKDNRKPINAPEVDVLAGVSDFDFAFARFGLGAGVDSSSWSTLLEDEEVVEVVESLDAESK